VIIKTIGTLTPTAMAVTFVPGSALGDTVESEDGAELLADSCDGAELMLAELEVRNMLCGDSEVSETDTAIFGQHCAIVAASQGVGIQFGAIPLVCPIWQYLLNTS
jgi:hypothetical protein